MPETIYRASVTIDASIGNGLYSCPGTFMPADYPYSLEFTAIIPDPATGGYWEALIEQSLGTPIELVSKDGASWDFFLSNFAEIVMYAWHAPMHCSGEDLNVYNPAPATIISAVLEVEGYFLLAVEPTTWGGIRELFR